MTAFDTQEPPPVAPAAPSRGDLNDPAYRQWFRQRADDYVQRYRQGVPDQEFENRWPGEAAFMRAGEHPAAQAGAGFTGKAGPEPVKRTAPSIPAVPSAPSGGDGADLGQDFREPGAVPPKPVDPRLAAVHQIRSSITADPRLAAVHQIRQGLVGGAQGAPASSSAGAPAFDEAAWLAQHPVEAAKRKIEGQQIVDQDAAMNQQVGPPSPVTPPDMGIRPTPAAQANPGFGSEFARQGAMALGHSFARPLVDERGLDVLANAEEGKHPEPTTAGKVGGFLGGMAGGFVPGEPMQNLMAVAPFLRPITAGTAALGPEARPMIQRGVQALVDLVGSKLGPAGAAATEHALNGAGVGGTMEAVQHAGQEDWEKDPAGALGRTLQAAGLGAAKWGAIGGGMGAAGGAVQALRDRAAPAEPLAIPALSPGVEAQEPPRATTTTPEPPIAGTAPEPSQPAPTPQGPPTAAAPTPQVEPEPAQVATNAPEPAAPRPEPLPDGVDGWSRGKLEKLAQERGVSTGGMGRSGILDALRQDAEPQPVEGGAALAAGENRPVDQPAPEGQGVDRGHGVADEVQNEQGAPPETEGSRLTVQAAMRAAEEIGKQHDARDAQMGSFEESRDDPELNRLNEAYANLNNAAGASIEKHATEDLARETGINPKTIGYVLREHYGAGGVAFSHFGRQRMERAFGGGAGERDTLEKVTRDLTRGQLEHAGLDPDGVLNPHVSGYTEQGIAELKRQFAERAEHVHAYMRSIAEGSRDFPLTEQGIDTTKFAGAQDTGAAAGAGGTPSALPSTLKTGGAARAAGTTGKRDGAGGERLGGPDPRAAAREGGGAQPGGAAEPPEKDSAAAAPAEPAPASAKFKAIADAALDRMKNRNIPRGRDVAATSIPDDVVDATIWAAARVAQGVAKTAEEVARIVREKYPGLKDQSGDIAKAALHVHEQRDSGGDTGGTTGIAHRVSEARGLEAERGAGINPEESVQRGRSLLKGGADPEKIIADFTRTKAVTADDMAVVRAHLESLSRAANAAADKYGPRSPEYKDAFRAESDWIARAKPMQTEWHKIGQAQQGETEIDTGTFHGLQRAFHDASGKDFSPAQARVAERTVAQVKAATEAADAAKAKLFKALDAGDSPRVASLADRISAKLDKLADDALARFKARHTGATLRSGIDPADLADLSIYGAAKIAKGVTRFAEWSAEMVKDVGEQVRPHLKTIWDASDKELDRHIVTEAGASRARTVRRQLAEAKASVDLAGHVPGSKMIPERVRQLWDRAKSDYIEKGTTNFGAIVHGLATDLGLPVDDIRRGLAQPKGARTVTNEMYAKQAEARRVIDNAKQWVRNAGKPRWQRAAESVPRALFTAKVFGHGTVGMVTHAGNQMFNPVAAKSYWTNFGRQFKLMGWHDAGAFHERAMEDLQQRANYVTARRAGLANDPYKHADDYQKSTLPKLLGKVGLSGNRGFDALKLFRQDLFDHQWDGLSAELKTPKMAEMIADSANHATGTVRAGMGGKVGAAAIFAPKLEGSRWAFLIGDPAKAARTFANWKGETPEARSAALSEVKQKAMIAGTYFGALAINQGLLSATGSGQKINYTDPTKPDFLAFKVAGHNVGVVSPLIGTARFLWNLGAASMESRKTLMDNKTLVDGSRSKTMAVEGMKYVRGKLSPFGAVAADVATQSDYQSRPMPFSSDPVPKHLQEKGIGRISYGEYATQTFLPIPAEEAIKEVWKGQGMGETDVKRWLNALAVGASSGATGARVTSDEPRQEKGSQPAKGPHFDPKLGHMVP